MFLKIKYSCVIVIIFSFIKINAQTITLFGTISDANTGELLTGANVVIVNNNYGCISNNYGFYSLTLKNGRCTVVFSYIGYQKVIRDLNLNSSTRIDLGLQKDSSLLKEITVFGNLKSKIRSAQMGSERITNEQIKLIPAAIGEPDLIKTLQFLPGIQNANEGTSNMNVRGGSFDQNLILIDESPVYNQSHALGLISTFNVDAIKDVTIYKGCFPSMYGGRLSSVVDITMREGNMKKAVLNGGIGLLSSRLTIEAPLIKDKSSFLIAGRYSYAGQVANQLGSLATSLNLNGLGNFRTDNKINFYDLNIKFNYKLNNKNHFYISAYTGRDQFSYYLLKSDASMDWGNITLSARWNHCINSKLFLNQTFYFSRYDYSYNLKDDSRQFKWIASINEIGLKSDFHYYLNPKNKIGFGSFAIWHNYEQGKISPTGNTSNTVAFSLKPKNSPEIGIYIDNEQNISANLSATYGLRTAFYANIGSGMEYKYSADMTTVTDSMDYKHPHLQNTFIGLEPRITLRYLFSENQSIKFSYSYTIQYSHLLSNSSIGLPTDIWVPSNNYIKPQRANQFSLGYFTSLFKILNISIEAYYKAIKNTIDYRDGADLMLNPKIETQILQGFSKSKGLEIFIEKNQKRIKGWMSYTLSKSDMQINGVNNNMTYPARFDIRHNFSTGMNFKFANHWSASSVFKLTSGAYITIPEGSFSFNGATFNYYSKRNGYHLPLYHRLDLSITYSNNKNNSKWYSEWVYSVINVYNRKNIFTLYVKQDTDVSNIKVFKLYLFGIIPTVTYNFRF